MYKILLKEIRHKKNITQEELSILSGVSQNYISEIENTLHDPTITILILICLSLKVTPNEILNWDNVKNENLEDLKIKLNENEIKM